MSVEIKEVKVKENQNIIEIPEIGVFRFVEHTDNNLVCCWDCDIRKLGICNVAPCSMSSRSDYKDGVFKLLNK